MKKSFFIYLAVGVVLGLLPLIVLPLHGDEAVGVDSALLFIIPIFVSQAGALWYFLTSVQAFQRGLRVAYYILSAGLVMFCLAQLQLPATIILSILGINPDLVELFLLIPYIFGTLVMYFAMRKFSKLLQIKSRWASVWVMLGFAVVVAVVSQILPKQFVPDVPDSPRFILGLVAASGSFGVSAAVVAWRIRQTIGASYKQSMGWLTAAFAVFGGGYLAVVLFQTLGSYAPAFLDTYTRFNLWLFPLAVVGFFFLRAGQEVRAISHQYGALAETATPLDVVIHTAELVSNPRAIDPILDTVRAITTSKQGEAVMSEEDNTKLVAVYKDIETYLLTKEPLRRFDRDVLRDHLPESFQQRLGSAKA